MDGCPRGIWGKGLLFMVQARNTHSSIKLLVVQYLGVFKVNLWDDKGSI